MILTIMYRKVQGKCENNTFGHFDPLNGIFYVTFGPLPQEGNTRDF